MAIIFSDVVNKINCGISGTTGTGTGVFCDIKPKDPIILCFTKPNVKVPLTTAVNETLFTDMIQKEDIISLNNIYGTLFETPDNETKTAESTGAMTKVLDLPVMLKVTFDIGLFHYQALKKLESNGYFNVFFFDLNRNMFVAVENGFWRGLRTLMVDVNKPISMGKNNEYQMTIQIDRYDYDNYLKAVEKGNLGFEPKTVINGYNDIDIKVTTPSAGTTFTFQTWATNNNKRFGLFGLAGSEIRIEKTTINAGVVTGWTNAPFTMLPTSLGSDPDYIVTMGTAMVAGEKYRIKTFDSTLQSNVILVEGVFYRSLNPANDNYFEFVVA